jgi:acyl carrier protein
MTPDVLRVVFTALAGTLGEDQATYPLSASLAEDLGLDSLDLVDILLRVEAQLAVQLPMTWMSQLLQGELSDAEFCTASGVVTDRGLLRLRELLPQIDPVRLSGKLRVDHIPSLLTVGNLVDIMQARVLGRLGRTA